MKYRVRLMPLARRDIERNAQWWAQEHSAEQAERWFNAVHEQLQALAQFPESHGLSPENDEFPVELRDKLIGLGSQPSYRAVFTIQGDTVHVLTVRRGAQQGLHPLDLPLEFVPKR